MSELSKFKKDVLDLEHSITELCGNLLDKYDEVNIEIGDINFYRIPFSSGMHQECNISIIFKSPMDEETSENVNWSIEDKEV